MYESWKQQQPRRQNKQKNRSKNNQGLAVKQLPFEWWDLNKKITKVATAKILAFAILKYKKTTTKHSKTSNNPIIFSQNIELLFLVINLISTLLRDLSYNTIKFLPEDIFGGLNFIEDM